MKDFYYSPTSPPCRSVLMVAKALGVELNLKKISPSKKENMTPEFLSINPQHTIPTLHDDGFAIWESRAILGYLVDKYGKDDSLYPKDPQKRAVVNQRLYFDMGSLYNQASAFYLPVIKEGKPADPVQFKKVEEALEVLDGFLSKTKYVAGDEPTIADYSLIATYSTVLGGGSDFSRFKNIARWYELRSNLPGIEINEEGVVAMTEVIKNMRAEAAAAKANH